MFTNFPFSRYRDIAILFLRVVVAVIFLYHGYQKWGFWSGTVDVMPVWMVWLFKILGVIEPLAGLAILLGLWTRGAALLLAIIMIGAIWMKVTIMGVGFSPGGATGWEFDLTLLAGCLMLVVDGPGRHSLAKMIR